MPEEVQVAPSPTQTETASSIPAELAKQMETSLKGFVPGMATEQPIPVTPPSANGQQQEPNQSNETVVVQPTEPFSILQQKFGWQKPEDAVTEIEQLRALKATPPNEIKFENEFSEKIFKAVQAGKIKEVTQLLSEQDRLESLTTTDVTDASAEQIIKMGMQLRYKDLTQQEIEYKFNKQYGFPKEPVQGDMLDEEFAPIKQAWQDQVNDIKMSRSIDAKLARPELESAKSKIVFPELPQNVDQEYVQWKQLMDKQSKLDAEIQEAYKAITPKSIETKIPFIDEANKIKFEFQYEPDSESLTKTVESATDYDKFLNSFVKSDGTFDKQEYLACIHFAKNRTAILTEAIKQSKNATIKSFLPDNGASGTQRQFPQAQEMSELDKQMKVSLNGFMPS